MCSLLNTDVRVLNNVKPRTRAEERVLIQSATPDGTPTSLDLLRDSLELAPEKLERLSPSQLKGRCPASLVCVPARKQL